MLILLIKHFLKQFFIFINKREKKSNNKSDNKSKNRDKSNNGGDNNYIYKLKVLALLVFNLRKKRFEESRRRREIIKFIINIINMFFTNFVNPRN